MGQMAIMSSLGMERFLEQDTRDALAEAGVRLTAGDTKLMWNPREPDEVKAARKTWRDLVEKKGFLGFRVLNEGDKGEQIREFDPDASKLIICPPMAGGA